MTDAYLIDRMPSINLGMKSPTELLLGQREFKLPPRVFGCVCFVRDCNTLFFKNNRII
jgi:hypothetical protein